MANFYVSITADGSSAVSIVGAFTGGESSYSYARRIKVTGFGSTRYFTSAESSGGTSTWDETISGLSSGTTYNWTATLQYWSGGWVDHPSFVQTGSVTTASVTAIHLKVGSGVTSFKVSYRDEYNASRTATINSSSYQTIYALYGSSVTWGTVTYEDYWSGEDWWYNQSGYSYPNVHTTTPDHSITSTYERWCYLDATTYTPPGYTIGIQLGTGISSIRVKYKNTSDIDVDTTFYANDSIRIKVGSKVTLIATASSPAYHFSYWTIDGSPIYGSGGTLEETPTGNETIIAWATANTHYVITYYKNDGSSSEPSTTVDVYGESSSLTSTAISCPWSRQHYTFLYWCTNRTGSGARTEYDPGDTITLTGNLSLYAIWSYNYTHRTIDISFPSGIDHVVASYTYQGSSKSTTLYSNGSITIDSGTTVTVTAYKALGYVFSTWTYGNSSQSQTVTDNPSSHVFTTDGYYIATATAIRKFDVVITAGSGATVSYSYTEGEVSKTGSVTSGSKTIQADHNTSVTCSYSISGKYRFNGWTYGISGSTPSTSSNTSVTISDLVYNGYFTCATVRIYDISAGVQTRSVRTGVSGSANKSTAEAGQSVTFTATINNSNYIFEGWYNAADGGTKVSSNSVFTTTVSSDLSLYVRISFVWTSDIESGKPAKIKATDWNELISFAKLRKSSSATPTPAVSGNSLTADQYNSLANVLNVTNRSRGDLVYASYITALSDAANAA